MNWIRSQADEWAVSAGCYFDEEAADRVVRFFRKFLRHSKGQFAGRPFELLSWEHDDLIAPIFGWKRADGTRRYRRCYVELAKKNGKSTLGAGIALYLLCGDNEPGAEVYSAAADRGQAKIVFKEARRMVEASPELKKNLYVIPYRNAIEYHAKNAEYSAMSSDAPTKEGLNIHGLIFDELHTQPNKELWDTLRYGGAARRQPLLFAITTAGKDVHSMCYEQHVYALNILAAQNNFRDDEYFAYIRAANTDDDIEDLEVWKKANPSYGITIKEEDVKAAIIEVKQNPSQLNSLKRYRLNIWCGEDSPWCNWDKWQACAHDEVEKPAKGAPVYVGIDLSSTVDICAAAAYFPETFTLMPKFWCLSDTIKRRIISKLTRYDLWVEQGFIHEVTTAAMDYNLITAYLEHLSQSYDIVGIVMDPWNATKYAVELKEDKGYNVVFCRQGVESLSAPMKELERLYTSGKLVHYGNPVLGWMAKNVVADIDANKNVKPNKKKSRESIDGIVASIMAIRGAMSNEDSGKSVYENRGVYVV
jgi:phage terminase large subunit-like protein